jgi:Mlc titration factor MtfA (ptsG expression regulator)
VRANVPLTRNLAPSDFERLLKLVQLFLAKKRFEAAGGLVLTEEMRLTVAAQACLLLVWRDTGLFPGLRTVLLYPHAVVPRYVEPSHSTMTVQSERRRVPVLGQSWSSGVVILSWDSTQHGAFDPADGKNVVLHEFAHQLDQETGLADGVPVGLPLSAIKPWAETLERRYKQLKKARVTGSRTVLDKYGAKNEAEFFAVVTEAFFEKPRQLRARKPDLYRLLSSFYGVDPAGGMRHVEESEAS